MVEFWGLDLGDGGVLQDGGGFGMVVGHGG